MVSSCVVAAPFRSSETSFEVESRLAMTATNNEKKRRSRKKCWNASGDDEILSVASSLIDERQVILKARKKGEIFHENGQTIGVLFILEAASRHFGRE